MSAPVRVFRIVVVLLVLVVPAALLWFAWPTASPSEIAQPASSAGEDLLALEPQRPRRERPVRPTREQMMAAGEASLRLHRQTVDELHTAAEAGDAAAQVELGRRLVECVGMARPEFALALENNLEGAVRSLRRQALVTGTDPTEEIAGQRAAVAALLEQHKACVLIGEAEVAQYHAWLERAARDGSVEAKLAYAELALTEYHNVKPGTLARRDMVGELGANLEEIVRRRDLAREWAQDAVEAGNFSALLLLKNAYGGSHPLYPRDHRAHAIYGHAADLALGWDYSSPEGHLSERWNAGPERYEDSTFTEAQWRDIQQQARRIYLRWYGEAPEG